jgi:hypothetical protein
MGKNIIKNIILKIKISYLLILFQKKNVWSAIDIIISPILQGTLKLQNIKAILINLIMKKVA